MRIDPHKHLVFLTLWTLMVPGAQGATTAEDVAEYLVGDWYVVELIVFARPEVLDFMNRERLVTTQPPPFPATIRSYFSDDIGTGYLLDDVNLAEQETLFTTISRPDTFAVPQEPTLTLLGPDEASPEATATAPEPPDGEPDSGLGATPPDIAPRLEPTPLMTFLNAVGEFEARLVEQSYRWAPPDEHVLRRSSRVLTRRFGHQVLLHGRWIQPVPPRDAPQPLLVQAGPRNGEVFQLEGALSITLGRYLHFHAQLVYGEPGLGLAPVWLPMAPPDGAPAIPALPRPQAKYMVLNESRRMRSDELHYLDHPKLGVIVRVDPVSIPEELLVSFKALEERGN